MVGSTNFETRQVLKKGISLSCCSKDESRSLGVGGRTLASNHPVRLELRALVVSDKGKGGGKPSGRYCGDAYAEQVEAREKLKRKHARRESHVRFCERLRGSSLGLLDPG